MRIQVAAALMLGILAAGCGTDPYQRGTSGAFIGGSAGAVAGAAAGVAVTNATLVGAGAGALAGYLTDPQQVDLGEPLWKNLHIEFVNAEFPNARRSSLVRRVQYALKSRGLYDGPLDGLPDELTARAIRDYQARNGLPADGKATPELLRHLEAQAS